MLNIQFALKLLKRRFLLLSLIIGVVLLIFFLNRPQANQIQFAQVKRGEITQTVSASGKLLAKNTIKLRSKVAGEITHVDVKEGDLVENGQLVVSLDNTEQAIILKQAENTLREKQASLDKVLDDIHLFQYGNGGFDNVGSSNETQTQRNLRTQAEVLKDNALDNLKLAQKKFDDTLILSPTPALVLSVNVSAGQTVSPQEVVIELADLSEVFFDAEVDQSDISKVRFGQRTELTLDAYPDQIFIGNVVKLLPQIKTITSGADVVIVRIKIDNLGALFISGLSGQGQIIIADVKNTLVIPVEALKDENKVVVQTIKGLEERDIELGIQSETDVEVKKGLNEREKVVLNPPSQLSLRNGGILRFFRR